MVLSEGKGYVNIVILCMQLAGYRCIASYCTVNEELYVVTVESVHVLVRLTYSVYYINHSRFDNIKENRVPKKK